MLRNFTGQAHDQEKRNALRAGKDGERQPSTQSYAEPGRSEDRKRQRSDVRGQRSEVGGQISVRVIGQESVKE